ncbi:MAG: type II CAAX endopeptidase family protein [Luteolibacter sp.]
MSDPTASVILIAFGAATALLIAGTIVRQFSAARAIRESRGDDSSPQTAEASGVFPYYPPISSPPPLPDDYFQKIPTSFYRRFDLLGVGALIAVFLLMALSSIQAGKDPSLKITPDSLVISIVFQFVLAGIVTAVVATRMPVRRWLGLRWEKWPWIFLIAPACVVFMWVIFGGLQAFGYMEWIQSLGAEPAQEAVKLLQTSNDPWTLGLMALAAVIVAPLCEEIVFRGYLYPVAKKYAGPWIAAIFSAVVFSCAHGNLMALFPLALLGLLLVFLYEKTGSIWSVIAVHFCFNGATVLIQILDRFYHFIPKDAL